MLRFIFNEDNIVFLDFYISQDGDDIQGPPVDTNDYLAYCMLREIAGRGKAGKPGEQVAIEYKDLYEYAQEEGQNYREIFQDFGFPPLLEKGIYLNCNGPISDETFVIECKILNNDSTLNTLNSIPFDKIGCIVKIQNNSYSLSPKQFELLQMVNDLNNKKPDLDEKLLIIANIKKLAAEIGNVRLHAIIESEEIIVPKSIKLRVDGDDASLSIAPEVEAENIEKQEFIRKFDTLNVVSKKYNFDRPDGGRRRLIFNPKQKRALEQIKKFRKITDAEKVREFIKNPPLEFDEADIDVSELYSERVKGIGIYRPKVYPFICSYKSDWLVGFQLEFPDRKDYLMIENEQELKELNKAIDESLENKKNYVDFKGQKIDVEGALLAAKQAELKFKKALDENYKPPQKVLLIKENVEELEYYIEQKNRPVEIETFDLSSLNCSKPFKDHQREGICTLLSLKKSGYPGAILADDMGLGKTLQILALLEYFSKNGGILACIVCPVGLIENWIQEYKESFPEGSIRFHDIRHEIGLLDALKDENDRQYYNNDIAIFSYEFLRAKQFKVCAIPWNIAVLDEAQRIKTPGTLVTNAAKALKARFKIAMTGTPVENSLHDLWCIADFCMPGFLGSAKEFSEAFNLKKNSSDEEIIQKGKELRDKLGLTLIRRIKSDVLKDLPPKYESDKPEHYTHFSSVKTAQVMPLLQTKVYNKVISDYKMANIAESKSGMIGLLQTLKMVSDHPLIIESFSMPEEMSEEDSAKCLALLNILSHIKQQGEKAIVFAEYRKTQRMLAMIISKNFHIEPRIINGDTPTESSQTGFWETRSKIIMKFNNSNGFNVIIMSPIAGGVGLTVTGANHVIHFSRHWNPAKEDQATDRAYRIGQNKPVYIYYLQAKHPNERVTSFDENLAKLLAAKRRLGNAVLFPSAMMEVTAKELYENIINSAS